MRTVVAFLLSTAALSSGCFDGKGSDGSPSEADNGVFHISFQASGPATLEVPFPTLESCQAPTEWMDGDVEAENATVEMRDASDGRTGQVVAVTGEGRVFWSVQIDLKDPCQPLRFDPWSIDPDVEGDYVEVRSSAGAPAEPTVLVRWVRSGCVYATLYEGEPAPAQWSSLHGRTIPVSCAS